MSRINPESEPAESSLPYGLRLWTGKRAKCCSSRFLAYLISLLLTVRKNSKCEFISGTHRLTTSPFSWDFRWVPHIPWMICKAKGINSSYSILPSAFMSACHQLRLGRCNFGLEAVATSQQSAFTCMNLEKSSRAVPSSQFFCKCPEDSTNLKPLADNQFHWFNVDYKYIEHIISTYSYIPSYHPSPANSRLFLSKFDLKFLPWKTPLAPRPGRAGSRPWGSRDAAASLASRLWTRLDPRTGWNPAEQFRKTWIWKKLAVRISQLGTTFRSFFPNGSSKRIDIAILGESMKFRVLIIFLEEVQYDGLNLIQRPQLLFASRCENHNCAGSWATKHV